MISHQKSFIEDLKTMVALKVDFYKVWKSKKTAKHITPMTAAMQCTLALR